MSILRRVGRSDLEIFPIALGANVFGWTADLQESFRVLDAYVEASGNFLDTSDSYSFWAPGNQGGESERVIGEWLFSRKTRDRVLIATKVSQHPEFTGIDPATIDRGIDASLARLGVDHVDLYYAHFDEPGKPLDPTARAFSRLVDSGKIRHIGISNFTVPRIEEWLRIADAEGLHRPVALQTAYNLMDRSIEDDLLPLARREEIGVMTYWALARGFLTGKYRTGAGDSTSPRAEAAAGMLTDRGRRVLAVVDAISADRDVHPATVAIAWLLSRDGVVAPIASARDPEQLDPILQAVAFPLTLKERDALDVASAREAT